MAQAKKKTATKTAKKTQKTCCKKTQKNQTEKYHIFAITAMSMIVAILLCASAFMLAI